MSTFANPPAATEHAGTVEYGVLYPDGTVSGGYTQLGARAQVEHATKFSDREWAPKPVRVMVRDVGEWRPA